MRLSGNSLFSSAFALATGLLFAAPAEAQQPAAVNEATGPAEIVVTAQRREEKSVDVPITITAVGQDALDSAGVRQLADLSKVVPALRFDKSGVYTQPTIRGVGTAITTSGGGPNVATYVDGFFTPSAATSDFQLLKVQSIQVLKGPQGTLFGRNTTGGAILVTTAEPSEKTGAEFKASYGRLNTFEVQGYATTGVAEGVAFDVEGLYRRSDGFQTNIVNRDDKVGQYERWSIRTGLKADISDNVSVLLRYIHSESDDPSAMMHNAFVDDNGQALIYQFTPRALYATTPDEVAFTDKVGAQTIANIVQGTIKADLGFADLTSYTQYRDEKVTSVQDLDASALPVFTIKIGSANRAFTQELLLNSKPGSRLQWTTGLYYFRNRDTWPTDAILGGGPLTRNGESSTLTQSFAAFADLTYEVTPQFFVTAGARYSHDRVSDAYFQRALTAGGYEDVNGNFVPYTSQPLYSSLTVPDLTNDRVTPRVVLRYKPDERSSIYASFTMGYKAGLLNVGGYSYKPVSPEKITAYEVGYKYSDRKLSADISGFYYDYKDLQVSSFQAGTAKITNAASSEIYGIEGQLSYRVTPDFNLSGGAAWTHARYKSFPNAPFYRYCVGAECAATALGIGSLIETTANAGGFKMQRSPEFTGNVAASYGIDVAAGRLTLSGNLYYTSEFYFGIAQQFRQEGYEQLGLRAEWVDSSEHISVAAFGDNVTGRRYRAAVNYASLGIGSVWAPPVTYGLQIGFKY